MDLMELIIETDGSPDKDEFMHRKHCLFLANLRAGVKSESKVACPTDQAIIARTLLGSGEWCNATRVRSEASYQMWCFRAIDAHACRLALHGHTHYEPLSAMGALPVEISPADLAAFERLCSDTSSSALVEKMERAADIDSGDDIDDDDPDTSDEDSGATTNIQPQTNNGHLAKGNLRSSLERLSRQLETPCGNQALNSDNAKTRGPQTVHE